ncbi:MAG: hypothetical protein IJ228_02020 [Succinivibrio sp.]|nr:hypothetical protein [Succinivibrio sp.]
MAFFSGTKSSPLQPVPDSHLESQLLGTEVKLISFDVFETLIARTVAKPFGVFSLMQNVLLSETRYVELPPFLSRNFASLRRGAYSYVKGNLARRHIRYDPTLEEVYAYLADCYTLTKEQQNDLIALELKVERACVVGCPGRLDLIERLIREGKRVVLISDMYLSASQIRELFRAAGAVFLTSLPLYVSCEVGAVKGKVRDKSGQERWGALYEYVHSKEQIPYQQWWHLGNSTQVDVRSPSLLGIKTIWLKYPELTPGEQYLLDSYTGCRLQLVTGFSITSRWLNSCAYDQSCDSYILGSTLAAPVLYDYVAYVVDDALSQGLEDLYFVSRDGFVLKEIASAIILNQKLALRAHYLYGSRQAWRVPTSATLKEFLLYLLSKATAKRDFKEAFLKLCGERFSSATCLLLKNWLQTQALPSAPSLRELHNLAEQLVQQPKLCKAVLDEYVTQQEALCGYLSGTIDLGRRFALVETSGTGFTQLFLQDIFTSILKVSPPPCYYLSLSPGKDTYFDLSKTLIRPYLNLGSDLVIEVLCRAPHGRVTGYAKGEDGHWYPKLENSEQVEAALKKWGFDDYLQGIKDYATMRAAKTSQNTLLNSFELSVKTYHRYMDYLTRFVEDDPKLCRTLGSIPYSVEEISERPTETFAKPMTLGLLLKCLLLRRSGPPLPGRVCRPISEVNYPLWKVLFFFRRLHWHK